MEKLDPPDQPPIAKPNLIPVPEQDCEWAKRDWDSYQYSLFPDAFYLPQTIEETLAINGQYYGPGPTDEGVQATFQGVDGFFRPGAVVLDIGSGAGRAVDDMIDRFEPRGISIIGLDSAYLTEAPRGKHTEAFIAGSWENMPFPNSTFSGLLSSETFPTHAWPDELGDGHARNQQTIDEITRIAQPGAVWRATVGRYSGLSASRLAEMLVERGWEVYKFPGLLVARLIPLV